MSRLTKITNHLPSACRLCVALVATVAVAAVTAGVCEAMGCRAEFCNAAGTLLGVVVCGGIIGGR